MELLILPLVVMDAKLYLVEIYDKLCQLRDIDPQKYQF